MNIWLAWIPSHMGIPGNDIADRLAKDSLDIQHLANHISYSIEEALPQINNYIIESWQAIWSNAARVRLIKYIFTCVL